MQRDNALTVLMDDIYIGANSIEELLSHWKTELSRCKTANIRLSPTKVTIAPKSTKILGWIWHQGGILTIDQHASHRLQTCDHPKTAEGLRGFLGAFRFMASAIPDHGIILQPLHTAVGEKSGSTPIEWTDELLAAFRTAQQSLDTAQPLAQPKRGEQLYMTTDASQKGIAATLVRRIRQGCHKAFLRNSISRQAKVAPL